MIISEGLSEHKIQTLAVNYLRLKLPPPFLIYAIPNGGLRHIAVAVMIKEGK